MTLTLAAPATQADELAELVTACRAAGCRPCPWGLALALGLDRDDTAAELAALIGAGRIKRRDLARDPDQLRPTDVPDFAAWGRRLLTAEGQKLTDAAIAGRARELEANWPKWGARTAAKDACRAEVFPLAPRVAALVAQARAKSGTGPTWAELGRVFGWADHHEQTVKVRYLTHSGWLIATAEARSLDIGPLGRAALTRMELKK